MTEKSDLLGQVEPVVNAIMGVDPTDVAPKAAQGAARRGKASSTSTVDWRAVGTYLGGTLAQIGLMIVILWGLQQFTLARFQLARFQGLNAAVAIAFFALVSIRSRLFSPLNNARTRTTYSSVQRPNWAPPPIAFPIIWMSIGVLRVVASYQVWQALGQGYLTFPLILFMVHLALGDTWNTIFTVEGRLGAAVPVVMLGPLLSAFAVVIGYWRVVPMAGQLLVPMVLWLGVASALVVSIWRLNGSEPWYPLVLDDSSTIS